MTKEIVKHRKDERKKPLFSLKEKRARKLERKNKPNVEHEI
jgi:hypothetical protein